MLGREAFSGLVLQRQPEPTAEMDDLESVRAFHEQGASSGPLLPVYHYNALATSKLVPRGGTLVDLGCGSGQYLAYLARRRPDLSIIGLDLSPTMLEVGREMLNELDLNDQVELREGDMTRFNSLIPERVDGLSSVFSVHHLPDYGELVRCLREISRVRKRSGCAVWIFDHARPRHPKTAAAFPEIFTPDAPRLFREDSRNSLIASFTFKELCGALSAADLEPMEHRCARFMPLYQIHWMLSETGSLRANGDPLWQENQLLKSSYRDFRSLQVLFPDVPLY